MRTKLATYAHAADLEARISSSLDELCGPGGPGGRGPAGVGTAEDEVTPSTAPSAGASSDA